jgi:hypothetical protein
MLLFIVTLQLAHLVVVGGSEEDKPAFRGEKQIMAFSRYHLRDRLVGTQVQVELHELAHDWFLRLEDAALAVVVETACEQPIP